MCACSAQDQIDMEHMVHIDVEELHTLIEGEEIMEAASLLMVLSSLLHFFFMPDCIHVYNMYTGGSWSQH